MSYALVINQQKQPQPPVHPAQARRLLSRGGSDRVSNLTLACEACNARKGTQTATEFGHPQIQTQAKQPLKDAAAVNTTRWARYERVQATGLPVEVGTGGRTKYNRAHLGLPTTHWLDAACVGASTPAMLPMRGVQPLLIRAMGHGTRQMCRMDSTGFRGLAPRRRGSSRAFGRVIWCVRWFPTARKPARMLDGLRYGRVGGLTSQLARQPCKVSRFAIAACCTTATALPITQGAAFLRTPDGGGFLPYFL